MNFQRNPGFSPNAKNKGQHTSSSVMTEFEELAIMEALDHLYVTKKYQEIGACTVCRKVSSKKCTGCGIFYCGTECQNSDWQSHKTVCNKTWYEINGFDFNNVPSVSSPKESEENTVVHSEKESFQNDTSLGISNAVSPFKALTNQVKSQFNKPWANSEEHKPVPHKFHNQQPSFHGKNEGKRFSGGGRGDVKKFPQNNDQKKNFFPKRAPNNFEHKNSKPESNNVKNDSWEQKSEGSILSKIVSQTRNENSSFTKTTSKQEVTCTYRESNIRYWVMNVNDLPLYEQIQTTLAQECDGYDSIQPKVGFVCGCNYADEWYRGKIVSLTPKPTVHFIDYGNTSEYDFGVFKKLPSHLKSNNGLAFLIEFEEGTPEEYKIEDLHSLKLSIKETRKAADGVSCVKITKGIFGVTSTTEETPITEKRALECLKIGKSVVDSLTESSRGMIIFSSEGGGSAKFGSVIPDNDEDAKKCVKETIQFNTSNLSPIQARTGDYVLVSDSKGNDQRGKVLYKLGNTYYVQTIDCGNIVVTESVFEMPTLGRDLINIGGLITITEIISQSAVSKLSHALFDITGEPKSGKWPCLLNDYSEQKPIAEGFIEKAPETLEADPQYATLKSGCSVELCNLLSSNSAYVRAIDKGTNEKIQEINGRVREYTLKAKSFKFPPAVGALCSAKFNEDQCFYRTRVISVKENKVNVLFVDFGNTQETDLKNVKPIPDFLKKIPFFAVKVALSKVSPKPCSKSVKEYVEKLIIKGTELTLLFKKSLTEGVTLKEKESGVIVNDFIENGNTEETRCGSERSSITGLLPKKVFTDDDLKYSSLVTGTKCELFLLHINETEFDSIFSFWATDGSSENLLNVFESLNAKIADYCENTKRFYRPKPRELCLALFDGGWYRALTVEESGDDFSVFFLDFGNVSVVNQKHIRRIKAEFVEDPILVVNCVINGHERLSKNKSLAKKVFELLEAKTNVSIPNVEVLGFENDTFSVVIPEVEKLLSE